jgi:alpha-D-ribose 1-methylphosphonate 5-triphosphate synthase subunit PhnI
MHRPVLYLKARRFGDWMVSLSSGGNVETTRRWLMSRIMTVILIYHRHKPMFQLLQARKTKCEELIQLHAYRTVVLQPA